jgi:succinate dehydrogenase/fumarate reductase flavoprotein subunit
MADSRAFGLGHSGLRNGKEAAMNYGGMLLYILMILSIMVFGLIAALKIVDYLKRKSEADKKEDKND